MKSENSVFSAKKVEDYQLPFEKLPNYFSFFDYENAHQPVYDPFDELIKAEIDQDYIPRQFRVAGTINQAGVDPVITGLIDVIQSVPELRDNIRITSAYRPGAITTNGLPSWHSKGLAVDIVPIDGDFKKMEKALMSSPQVVQYLIQNNLGILDEYSENGVQSRTGATGAHFHFGRDRKAILNLQTLLERYGYANS